MTTTSDLRHIIDLGPTGTAGTVDLSRQKLLTPAYVARLRHTAFTHRVRPLLLKINLALSWHMIVFYITSVSWFVNPL